MDRLELDMGQHRSYQRLQWLFSKDAEQLLVIAMTLMCDLVQHGKQRLI